MKNILPVSKQKILKFTLPPESMQCQTNLPKLSFNGMHTIYKGIDPDELFSIFTSDIINHTTGSKK